MEEMHAEDGPTLEIGGRVRRLRMSMRAIKLIRQETGVDLLRNPLAFDELPSESIAVVLWAALVGDDESLKAPEGKRQAVIEQVEDWILPGDLPRVMLALQAAMQESMPDAEPRPLPVSQPGN